MTRRAKNEATIQEMSCIHLATTFGYWYDHPLAQPFGATPGWASHLVAASASRLDSFLAARTRTKSSRSSGAPRRGSGIPPQLKGAD